MNDIVFDLEVLKKELKEKLQNEICEITFTKVDGSRRVMNCTLRADKIPDTLSEEKSGRTKAENPDVQAVYDVDATGWRSFRWSSFISVREDKV